MKNFFVLLVFLFNIGCVSMVNTTNSMFKSATQAQRNILQIDADSRLEKEIKKDLKESVKEFSEENNIRLVGDFKIAVMENRVLITGLVSEQEIKNFINEKVWGYKKVKEVINEIQISLKLTKITNDTIIKNNVSSKLTFTSNIKSSNYRIFVVNGIVYIIGISENQEELEKVTFAISTVKGVREVVSHIILKDDSRRVIIEL